MKFLDYIQGHRKGSDANEIETKSLTDPFLADAIDGYDSVEGNHWMHIVEMQDKVKQVRTPGKVKRMVRIIAAAVVFFAILSGYFYLSDQNNYTNLMSYVTSTSEKVYPHYEGETLAADMTQHEQVAALAMNTLVEEDVANEDTSSGNAGKDVAIDNAVKEAFAASDNVISTDEQDWSQSLETVDKNSDRLIQEESVASKPPKDTDVKSLAPEPKSRMLRQSAELSSTTNSNVDKVFTEAEPTVSEKKQIEPEKQKKQKTKSTESKDNNSKDKLFVGAGVTEHTERHSQDAKAPVSQTNKQERKPEISNERSVPVIGDKDYKKYIKKNMKYPKKGKCADLKGTVVLEFKVTDTGRPINIRVVKSLCADLDQEAIRLLRKGSDWTPSDKSTRLIVTFDGDNED